MLSFSFFHEKMCDANFFYEIMYLLRKGFRHFFVTDIYSDNDDRKKSKKCRKIPLRKV